MIAIQWYDTINVMQTKSKKQFFLLQSSVLDSRQRFASDFTH